MKLYLILIATILISSCSQKKAEVVKNVETNPKVKEVENNPETLDETVEKKLTEYFKAYEIAPIMEIENKEGKENVLKLLTHKIAWIDSKNETKVKIDKDIFSLKGKLTLNEVNGEKHDDVDFANNWDEMKLYKFNGREIIGIRMNFDPCVGIGCGVDYYLFYDTKTKSKNFFGTYHTERELSLYDINNDKNVDYISKTFMGDAHGYTPTYDIVYKLYSLELNGKFIEQKDSKGVSYYLGSCRV
jgi:hypothetical protein